MTSEKAPRILVVDDEPNMASGIRRILKIKGYEVVTANSGEEAIEQARVWQPDGILMDIKMPGIDGVEAYRRIRTFCPKVFVIFMTGFSILVEAARKEGAVDILTKPLDPADLCDLIARTLANASSADC